MVDSKEWIFSFWIWPVTTQFPLYIVVSGCLVVLVFLLLFCVHVPEKLLARLYDPGSLK